MCWDFGRVHLKRATFDWRGAEWLRTLGRRPHGVVRAPNLSYSAALNIISGRWDVIWVKQQKILSKDQSKLHEDVKSWDTQTFSTEFNSPIFAARLKFRFCLKCSWRFQGMKTKGCHTFFPIRFLTLPGRAGVPSHQGTSGYPSRYQGEQHPDRRWCLGENLSHNWKPHKRHIRSLHWWHQWHQPFDFDGWQLDSQFTCRWHCEVGGFRLLQANGRDLNVPRIYWTGFETPVSSVGFVVEFCTYGGCKIPRFYGLFSQSIAVFTPSDLLVKAHHARIHPLDGTRGGVGTLPRSRHCSEMRGPGCRMKLRGS